MDPSPTVFCVEGRPNDSLVTFLKSLGLRHAAQNLITQATLVVVSQPQKEIDINIADIAAELGKRVIIIGRAPKWLFAGPVEIIPTIDAFETLMRQESAARKEAVLA